MNKEKLLLMAALSGLISGFSAPNAMAKDGYVECVGISPSGSNSCAGNSHACAGYAQTDYDPSEWNYVKEGSCEEVKRIMKNPVMRGYVKEVATNAFKYWRRAPIPTPD